MPAIRLLLALLLAAQPLSAAVLSVPVRMGAPGAGAGVSGAALGQAGGVQSGLPGNLAAGGTSLGPALPGLNGAAPRTAVMETEAPGMPAATVQPAVQPAVQTRSSGDLLKSLVTLIKKVTISGCQAVGVNISLINAVDKRLLQIHTGNRIISGIGAF